MNDDKYIPLNNIRGLVINDGGKMGVVSDVVLRNSKGWCLEIDPIPELDNIPQSSTCESCQGIAHVKKCFDLPGEQKPEQPVTPSAVKPMKIRFIPTVAGALMIEIENPNVQQGQAVAQFIHDFNNTLLSFNQK